MTKTFNENTMRRSVSWQNTQQKCLGVWESSLCSPRREAEYVFHPEPPIQSYSFRAVSYLPECRRTGCREFIASIINYLMKKENPIIQRIPGSFVIFETVRNGKSSYSMVQCIYCQHSKHVLLHRPSHDKNQQVSDRYTIYSLSTDPLM